MCFALEIQASSPPAGGLDQATISTAPVPAAGAGLPQPIPVGRKKGKISFWGIGIAVILLVAIVPVMLANLRRFREQEAIR